MRVHKHSVGSSLAAAALAATLLGAFALPAAADVLTLKNGKEQRGLIDEAGSDAKFVKIATAQGSLKVPRDRIKSVAKESPGMGYVHIGDDYREGSKLTEAIASYQEALKAEPGLAAAKERLAAVQADIDAKGQAMRKDEIQLIDKLRKDVQTLIGTGEFEKAEQMLEKTSELVPTDAQKKELRKVVADLYLAWSRDRQDRFDRAGAEDKLNLAYAANPESDEIINALLAVWENQADKQEKITTIYETLVERRPNDEIIRRKLADIYYRAGKLEPATQHYLTLYKQSNKYKGTDLETRLIESLERLHAQFAGAKDYEKAIFFYRVLSSIDPKTDPAGLTYYTYLQRAQTVAGEDVPGRAKLAEYAAENGLDDEALKNYRLILQKEPENAAAKKALDRYANTLADQAAALFNKREYIAAQVAATQVQTDFPEAKEANERVLDIITSSNNEIAKQFREQAQVCKAYIERGDQYYQQALVFYRDFFDTTRSSRTTTVSSPKNDAIRYFKYAIQMYETALKTCPDLKSDPASLLGPNLSEAKLYLARLAAPLPSRRSNSGPIIGPNNSNTDSSGRIRR